MAVSSCWNCDVVTVIARSTALSFSNQESFLWSVDRWQCDLRRMPTDQRTVCRNVRGRSLLQSGSQGPATEEKSCSTLVHCHCNKSKWSCVWCCRLACMYVSPRRSWNYLCTLCSVQVLRCAANSNGDSSQMENDICEKSAGKKKNLPDEMKSGPGMANQSFGIGCRLIVAPPVHLLFMSLTTSGL